MSDRIKADAWDWDAWEADRYATGREHARADLETKQRRDRARIPLLLDEIDRLQIRAYVFEQCALAAVDVINDLRGRLDFESRLLTDVLRERAEVQ